MGPGEVRPGGHARTRCPLRRPAERDFSDKPSYYPQVAREHPTEKLRLRDVDRQRAEAIYAWDVQFGKMITALKRTGEYANTVLVFTSDNGYYIGEHRHPAGKIKHHEVSSGSPWWSPDQVSSEACVTAPDDHIDLTATILDLANAAPLPGMDGTSRWPVTTGADPPWPLLALFEAPSSPKLARTSPGDPARLSELGVRTGRYKYVRYSTGAEELYDITKGPERAERALSTTRRTPRSRPGPWVTLWDSVRRVPGGGLQGIPSRATWGFTQRAPARNRVERQPGVGPRRQPLSPRSTQRLARPSSGADGRGEAEGAAHLGGVADVGADPVGPVSTDNRKPSSSSSSTRPTRAPTTRPRTTYAEPCTCSRPLSGGPGSTSPSATRCREPATRSPGCTRAIQPAGRRR